MSQVYVKRCNKCAKVAISPNTPNPPGWQSLADMLHGTLASFDLCPECQAQMGIKDMLTQSVRDRASGALKAAMDQPEIPSVDFAELEARIQSGDFDAAFASGDGIDLFDSGTGQLNAAPEDEIAEGELVES